MKHTAREQSAIYDVAAPKRAANVTVYSDLLRRARELGVNLPQVLEEALVDVVRQRAAEQWLAEHREAIDAYNRHVERNGAFGDRHRTF